MSTWYDGIRLSMREIALIQDAFEYAKKLAQYDTDEQEEI